MSERTFIDRERRYVLRPFRWTDVPALSKLIADSRFDYPFLTGASHPGAPLRPWRRAFHYGLSICVAERLGWLLFRERRHWFRVIAAAGSDRLIGMILLDEIIRRPPGGSEGIGASLLKGGARRDGARLGDAEIGMFISPDFRRQGLTLGAMWALVRELSRPDGRRPAIVRRLWGETSATNHAARALLEKMGMQLVDTGADAQPERFDREGAKLRLVCYRQPDGVGPLWRDA